jgi:hypothetical protein
MTYHSSKDFESWKKMTISITLNTNNNPLKSKYDKNQRISMKSHLNLCDN